MDQDLRAHHPLVGAVFHSLHCVHSEGTGIVICHHINDRRWLSHVLEEVMDIILTVVVLFLVFGGGGYWGYRRWR